MAIMRRSGTGGWGQRKYYACSAASMAVTPLNIDGDLMVAANGFREAAVRELLSWIVTLCSDL